MCSLDPARLRGMPVSRRGRLRKTVACERDPMSSCVLSSSSESLGHPVFTQTLVARLHAENAKVTSLAQNFNERFC